jgi:hypothetical protein
MEPACPSGWKAYYTCSSAGCCDCGGGESYTCLLGTRRLSGGGHAGRASSRRDACAEGGRGVHDSHDEPLGTRRRRLRRNATSSSRGVPRAWAPSSRAHRGRPPPFAPPFRILPGGFATLFSNLSKAPSGGGITNTHSAQRWLLLKPSELRL